MIRMYKMPAHQKFEYRPRHFDPDKEEFERRVKAREITKISERDELRYRMSATFKRKRHYTKVSSKDGLRSNITVAIIAGILALMSFLLLGNLEHLLK
jgi:hypothetical protein